MRWPWVVLLVALLAAGCKKNKDDSTSTPDEGQDSSGSSGSSGSSDSSSAGEMLSIRVSSSALTNDGRPLYTVVRAVTLQNFVEDRYQDVADLVVQPDDTVLASFLVFPGIDYELSITKPEAKTIGVYCLFTGATGTSWKRLYEEPLAIELELGADRLEEPSS